MATAEDEPEKLHVADIGAQIAAAYAYCLQGAILNPDRETDSKEESL